MSYIDKLQKVALKVPNVLLPNQNVNLEKFSVIAGDQFSFEKEYWRDVENFVGDCPSSLNLIFPEAYMPLTDGKLLSINNTMKEYLRDGILQSIGEGFVYVKRMTTSGVRKGLMALVDLTEYDYNDNSKTLIRVTEKTVKDRLPIRVKIRKEAILDIPHIMLLFEDKKNILMDYIESIITENNKMYDFNLMKNGNNIKGYYINNKEKLEHIADIFLDLKQGIKDNLLFAIGDGNHSLAAAKICYENDKSGKKRYALCELVNIYDDAVEFFPIHRLIINVDKDEFLNEINIDINHPPNLQYLQPLLDKYLDRHKETKLEYIHGKEECARLSKNNDKNISIIYDRFMKEEFFCDIINNGSLCMKTFSIGKNVDKRYYLESSLLI